MMNRLLALSLLLGVAPLAAHADCPNVTGTWTCDLPKEVVPNLPTITFRASQEKAPDGNTVLHFFFPYDDTTPDLTLVEGEDFGDGQVGSLKNESFYCAMGKIQATLASAAIVQAPAVPPEMLQPGQKAVPVTIWSNTIFTVAPDNAGGLSAGIARTRTSTDPSLKSPVKDSYAVHCRAGTQ